MCTSSLHCPHSSSAENGVDLGWNGVGLGWDGVWDGMGLGGMGWNVEWGGGANYYDFIFQMTYY